MFGQKIVNFYIYKGVEFEYNSINNCFGNNSETDFDVILHFKSEKVCMQWKNNCFNLFSF